MKKLLIILLALPFMVDAQTRQIPKGGTAGQTIRIGTDGKNLAWVDTTDLANYVEFSDTVSTIATKSDVDSIVSALSADTVNGPLYFVNAATTANVSGISYLTNTITFTSNGRLGAYDGVTLDLYEYILLKNQSTGLQNGIYYVYDTGTVSTPAILVRDSLYDETSEVYPSQVNVLSGTINGGKYYLQTAVDPLIGTDAITYTTTAAPTISPTLYSGNGTIAANRTVNLLTRTLKFQSNTNTGGKFEVSAGNISMHNGWNNNSIDILTPTASTGYVIARANTYIRNLTAEVHNVTSSGTSFNSSGSSPAASSIVDISSTTKGLLIPRMTTVQRDAIGTPATGLMVYNTTTSAYNYYNGSAWTTIGSNIASANLTANASYTTTFTGYGWTLKGGTFTREGSGSTSATTTVLFQNSSGTELFKIKDNGYALMGSTAGTGFEFDNDQSSQYPGMTVYSAIGGNVARLGYLKSYCAMSASSGYFGLGTINPENKLHIYDNSATQNVRLGIYENTYNDYPNSIYHDYRLRYAGGISDVGNSPIARITASGVITGANNSTYKGSYTINLRDNSTLTQILKVSAPGVINLKPITAATATALTPSEGDMLFVNSTDATFTSIGFWGYQNGTWTKM